MRSLIQLGRRLSSRRIQPLSAKEYTFNSEAFYESENVWVTVGVGRYEK
jgi:hypothetical protein